MSNFGAIYIYLPENSEKAFDEVNEILKNNGWLFTLRYHKSLPWAQAWTDEPENIPNYIKSIAELFPETRIIGIACQSVMDAIGYWDIVKGEEQRVLEYGFFKERVWEKAEGKPQDWEQEIFQGRDGYKKGENYTIGHFEPFFNNFDVHKIGQLLELPGFGTSGHDGKWTKEI
ncbi:hypothetical protein QUF70_08280, partial [Desulfobacterales bacterium HSG17]|nr:hypothetical protein [Desulfobacterales bacterium HSG17]